MAVLARSRSLLAVMFAVAVAVGGAPGAWGQAAPNRLSVDASEVARGIYHMKATFPVKAGALTLAYPKWIPGHHRDAGPIINLVGLKLSANGKTVPWRRDDVDMFAFHCDVPAGAGELQAAFDYVSPPGSSQSVVVTWNELLLYPKGAPSDEIPFVASLKLPDGWKYATPLPIATSSPEGLTFKQVSLTTLVDSPVLTGAHFKSVPINAGQTPAHFLDMVSDSDAALEMKPELVTQYGKLVDETGALFGSRHYGQYHWLLTLNSKGGGGLEHHECSDDHGEENAWQTEGGRRRMAGLLAHEYIHSWCGKFRRPAGLATPDYQEPMKGELLWVYEGMTEYLATIICPRAGLLTADEFHERLAETAAGMDYTMGRQWRPLLDTTVGAPILYSSPTPWRDYRRSTDFYPEGVLLWLQVDVMIRQQTGGKKSLNDFCQKFFGGPGGAPALKPYDMEEVVATLNEVSPHDWKTFLTGWLTSTDQHMPLSGVIGSGWKVVYNETASDEIKSRETQQKVTNLTYSIGALIGNEDNTIRDIVPGMAADKAGLAPGMKLVAVNGRKWTPELLKTAIKQAKGTSQPIDLLIENNEFYKSYTLDYHEGARYPHLERDTTKPDLLTEIAKPMQAVTAP